jgi:DNA-binding PadR family transcriptional regulator
MSCLEGNTVSTSKSDFEPREALEGLWGYVKDMATNAVSRGTKFEPSEDQIDAALLGALESGSKTATDITKAITLASGGSWTPTDGQVNRSLTKLSDTDMVSAKTKADRKTYTITKEGLAWLEAAKENAPAAAKQSSASSKMNMNLNWMTCDPHFLTASSKLPPVLLDIAQTGTKEQQAKAAAILDKARHDLHVALAEK